MLCVSHEIVTSYVDKLMSARTAPTAVVRRADAWAHRQSARSAYAWRCSARRIVSGKKIERSANPSGASAREGFSFSSRPGRFVEARALGASVRLPRPEQRQLILKFTGTS